MCECFSRVKGMHISAFTCLIAIGRAAFKVAVPTFMGRQCLWAEGSLWNMVNLKRWGRDQYLNEYLGGVWREDGVLSLAVTPWGLWASGKRAEQKIEWFAGRGENIPIMQKETWESSKWGCPAIRLCWGWGGSQDVAASVLKLGKSKANLDEFVTL